MSFENITRKYLKAYQEAVLSAERSGTKANELATRPVVHNYIEDIASLCKKDSTELIIHHDTNYTKTDRPDWRIEDKATFGVFCFGDHKSLSQSNSYQLSDSEKKQIDRYLKLGRPVFVFDGIEFIFYKENLENNIRCQLIEKPLKREDQWHNLDLDISVESQFRTLLENPGFRKWSDGQLIQQLARRARSVANEIEELLEAPCGSGSSKSEEDLLNSLHSLKDMLVHHHDPSLRDSKACADFVAQVLIFGLFYAHTQHTKSLLNPTERKLVIQKFWFDPQLSEQSGLLRPFKTIVTALSSSLSNRNILSDWYAEVLSVLAHAEYMGTMGGPQDFHSLFENFLSAFDEKARFDRGAFYTPKNLTNWIARAADSLSFEVFKEHIMESAERIIDPCCGTGGFLEAVYLLKSKTEKVNPTLIGFEILPAPYALAHYRLAELFEGDANPPDLKIILTDTLSDQLLNSVVESTNGFEEELRDAITLSNPPLRVVIGNPPSSSYTASYATRTVIESKLNVFRPPKMERSDRQNIQKALNNEAYKFLRWCADKTIESGKGILALVMPGSFARSVSFKFARKWILDNFQKIYILEIDADARRGDATHSIFSVMQGRLVIIASLDLKNASSESELFFQDISNQHLSNKIDYFNDEPKLSSFQRVIPSSPQWRFSTTEPYPEALWMKGWPLTETSDFLGIFLKKCSAIKLAPTAMLFHTQPQILQRRSLDLSLEKNVTENVIKRWFSGQKKLPSASKLTQEVKKELKSTVVNKQFTQYLFRPFTYGVILNSNSLFSALKKTDGGGLRDRPEVRTAFANEAIGIALAPSPMDLGATLTRFACFAWNLPDNDIAARGNAMIYCDRFPDVSNNNHVIDNVNKKLISLFSFSNNPIHSVCFYIYAILSSPAYLDAFEGVLYSSSDPTSPPRVLISSDESIRKEIANLGEKIAECEKSDYLPVGLKSLSVMWPPEFDEFDFVRWDYVEPDENLILYGTSDQAVSFSKVPPFVIGLKISGHLVLDKWLRERTSPYLIRKFTKIDADQLVRVIRAIFDQEDFIQSADVIIDNMIQSERVIIPFIKS